MVESKKRSIAEIQAEYQNQCLKAGHCQYQIFTFSKELEMINQVLRDLNLEASAVKAAEDKVAQEEKAESEKALEKSPEVVAPQEVSNVAAIKGGRGRKASAK